MEMKQNRTILITGASRGLGRALAQSLAREGWRLIIDARGGAELEKARKEISHWTEVKAISGDISDVDHRADLLNAAQGMGGLDAIVNNAGILGPSPQPNLLDYPLDVLEQVYRVNVIAQLALIQTLRYVLKARPIVINITSDAGVEAYEGWGGYGSSKAALEQLSAVLAVENPLWHIYWVDPGDMQTEMHQLAYPGEDISDRPKPEESVPGLLDLLQGKLPNGRYKVQEIPSIDEKINDRPN